MASEKNEVFGPRPHAGFAGLAAVILAMGLGACGSDDPSSPATALEPAAAPTPVAVVLGEEIASGDADEISQTILDKLFARYRREHDISVTDAEIEQFVNKLEQGEAEESGESAMDDLTAEEQQQVKAMRHDMGRAMVEKWKLNRALYQQYGGRVIAQQLGAEPLDAYREFLEAQQASGAFVINDAAIEQHFWEYFRDESMHDFLPESAAAEAFAAPPWE